MNIHFPFYIYNTVLSHKFSGVENNPIQKEEKEDSETSSVHSESETSLLEDNGHKIHTRGLKSQEENNA